MKSKLEHLKLLTKISYILLLSLVAVMFIHIGVKFIEALQSNYGSIPAYFVIIYAIYYIVPIIIAFTIHLILKRKLKKAEIEEGVLPLQNKIKNMKIKDRVKKLTIKNIIIFLGFLLIILFIIPITTIYLFVNVQVRYLGESSMSHTLQKVYEPTDFEIKAKELTIVTEDNLNLWCSEVTLENPKAVIIYLTGIKQPSVTYFYGHSKWMKENGYASFLSELMVIVRERKLD